MHIKQVHEIKKYNNLGTEEFKSNFFEKKEPVIISNSFDWPAIKKWNMTYLKELYPDKSVVLTLFPTGLNEEVLGTKIPLKMPAAIDLILNNSNKNNKYYLMQQSMYQDFSELIPDIVIPKYAINKEPAINFWLGESGVNTRPHYDLYHGFLTQVMGTKRVRLFPPSDTPNMYPHCMDNKALGNNGPSVHISRVSDIDLVDSNSFPNLNNITCFESVITTGDLLYIPAGWWHEVKSLETSISINFWWTTGIEDLFVEQSTAIICSFFNCYGNDSFDQFIRKGFELSKFQDNLQIAKFAISNNLKCVSAIFLLSYLYKISDSNFASDIPEWIEYLEIAKTGDNNLLETSKIMHVINQLK